MYIINISVIATLIVAALLGYLLGFGKSIKMTAGGVVGIIISIAVCVMLGGTVKNFSIFARLIEKADYYFARLWDFLGKIHFGTVVYYVIFFVVIQITRIIIAKIVSRICKINNKAVKIINRIIGAVFVSSFCFSLCLLCLAGFKVFENAEFVINLLAKIEGSFLWTLYINNPIVF